MNAARREPIDVPVLCIGNFTVGGAGKTPAAIALAHEARRMQLSPGFLSRGFGGKFPVPHVVDVHHDSARHVGDEPLLLAEHAPVAVTPDRAAGAKLLASRGCDFLIMDDGFQSARIHMDYALLVVDGRRGVGNGHVIPGGPVRAPLVHQMRFAHAVLKMGDGEAANDIVRMASRAGRPVYEAHRRIRDPGRFAGRRFLAFAGIGDPEKFFHTVAVAGGEVEMTRSFADHHFFTKDDLADLSTTAAEKGLELDHHRQGRGPAAARRLARKSICSRDRRAGDRPCVRSFADPAHHHRCHAHGMARIASERATGPNVVRTVFPRSRDRADAGVNACVPSRGAAPDRSRSRASARRWR